MSQHNSHRNGLDTQGQMTLAPGPFGAFLSKVHIGQQWRGKNSTVSHRLLEITHTDAMTGKVKAKDLESPGNGARPTAQMDVISLIRNYEEVAEKEPLAAPIAWSKPLETETAPVEAEQVEPQVIEKALLPESLEQLASAIEEPDAKNSLTMDERREIAMRLLAITERLTKELL